MRIAFLAGCNSIHTVKWVNEMAVRGHKVHLITMHPGKERLHTAVDVHYLPLRPWMGYFLNTWHLKKLLKEINPDIMNSHYASGYGTLARLAGFEPNLLSVWGSDVFDFPFQSKLRMRIMQKNLKAASRIASTSRIMKLQIESIFKPVTEIALTPFGVDCEQFKPVSVKKPDDKVTIGTVKRMAPKYGISTLIKAFAIVKENCDKNMELLLIGGGPQEEELKVLAQELGIEDYVRFVGPVPHDKVPVWLNKMDIYVALSTMESFGVAVIEASACGIPVVVSDAGGLPEVIIEGETGFIVPRENPEAAAQKIELLIDNENLRNKMGQKGRAFVLENYEWKENADRMEALYREVIQKYNYKNRSH